MTTPWAFQVASVLILGPLRPALARALENERAEMSVTRCGRVVVVSHVLLSAGPFSHFLSIDIHSH